MPSDDTKKQWDEYNARELADVMIVMKKYGYRIQDEQPHIQGERFLMQAVTTQSGRKLILIGRDRDRRKVVIKATRDKDGIRELEHERTCRRVLSRIDFAGEAFHTPHELFYIKEDGFVIAVQEFIEQDRPFSEHALEEQFRLSLQAFKAQESAHATTSRHHRLIKKTFGVRTTEIYLTNFKDFITQIAKSEISSAQMSDLLTRADNELTSKSILIEQYGGFLTHTDFVPHNFRIQGNTMYLLDHSALIFGNKYEGWARFVNFMSLHNPPLQQLLEDYVRDNRSETEVESLRLMRIYRLGEIAWYYTNTLNKCSGDLFTLNSSRVNFWSQMLSYVLQYKNMPRDLIDAYSQTRDSLRSDEEKKRQIGLN